MTGAWGWYMARGRRVRVGLAALVIVVVLALVNAAILAGDAAARRLGGALHAR